MVACDLPGLAALAQEHLDRALAHRQGADITRVIQKLFDRQADLFPIRDQGGVYFVPIRFGAFVDRVQEFVNTVGGRLARFPVPVGTPQGDRAVQEAVAEGLSGVIAEHRAAVAGFGDDTRESTLRRAAERVRATRFKLEAYAELLAGEKARLERELAAGGGGAARQGGEPLFGRRSGGHVMTPEVDLVRRLCRAFMARPALWPLHPFLPVARHRPGGATDLGVLYDAWGTSNRTGFSATVFLQNVLLLPATEAELLAGPREVYDGLDELLDARWRVD